MYAWSRFAKTTNEWGRVDEWIEPGDEITQSDLDLSDDEWQELQDLGAVREEPFPELAAGQSPAEYYRENPDEAPEIDVDAETTQPEAMEKIDSGLAAGMKLPVEEGAPDDVATQAEQQTEEKSSAKSGDTPSSGGGTPSG